MQFFLIDSEQKKMDNEYLHNRREIPWFEDWL